MPFNLLLLPLLGGYIFVRFWNHTKIHILRSDKDRLLIRASIAGLFSLIIAFILATFVQETWPCVEGEYCVYTWWAHHVPFEYSGISLLSFIIPSLAWLPMNWFWTLESEIDRAIDEDGDPLEIALKKSKDQGLQLAFTLEDQKVYVGIVTHVFNPATPTTHIAILPLQSGYRDPRTKRMHLKVNYAIIIKGMLEQIDDLAKKSDDLTQTAAEAANSGNRDQEAAFLKDRDLVIAKWEDLRGRVNLFELVIPERRIHSVFYFDPVTYNQHFSTESQTDKNPQRLEI
ncbi:MAG: hypothetical protein UZ17_ACD001002647 [Acidobacteria bacterium OLB17]|nr:MAG: hypothetical protein UZ17_ACD001002647 [Acidobacteria bacterium OLB17]MCZ2390871.1 hypothetical protein [Acidobacteriota bacterium]